MAPLAHLVQQIYDDSESGDIKLKSQSFLKMWNEKSDLTSKTLREIMDEKLSQYKSLGKPIVETHEINHKPINVDIDAVVIKRRRRKTKPKTNNKDNNTPKTS